MARAREIGGDEHRLPGPRHGRRRVPARGGGPDHGARPSATSSSRSPTIDHVIFALRGAAAYEAFGTAINAPSASGSRRRRRDELPESSPTDEQRDELVEEVAREIQLRGLTSSAVLFLEASRGRTAPSAPTRCCSSTRPCAALFGGELAVGQRDARRRDRHRAAHRAARGARRGSRLGRLTRRAGVAARRRHPGSICAVTAEPRAFLAIDQGSATTSVALIGRVGIDLALAGRPGRAGVRRRRDRRRSAWSTASSPRTRPCRDIVGAMAVADADDLPRLTVTQPADPPSWPSWPARNGRSPRSAPPPTGAAGGPSAASVETRRPAGDDRACSSIRRSRPSWPVPATRRGPTSASTHRRAAVARGRGRRSGARTCRSSWPAACPRARPRSATSPRGPARSCSRRRPTRARRWPDPLATLLLELALPGRRPAPGDRRRDPGPRRRPRSAGRDRSSSATTPRSGPAPRRRPAAVTATARPGRRADAPPSPRTTRTTRSSTASSCGRPCPRTGIACATGCASCASRHGRTWPARAPRCAWPPPGRPSARLVGAHAAGRLASRTGPRRDRAAACGRRSRRRPSPWPSSTSSAGPGPASSPSTTAGCWACSARSPTRASAACCWATWPTTCWRRWAAS